jgi:flagellar protein FliJ
VKGLAALIRLHRWQLDEKRRELAELERLEDKLLEFGRQIDREVAAEQEFAQNSDVGSLSYGGFTLGVIERRRRLAASLAEVRQKIDAKGEEVAEAFRELKRFEITQAEREKREKIIADQRAQAALDEIAMVQHQRKQV